MKEKNRPLQPRSSAGEIAAFLRQAEMSRPEAGGRLIFALDATASRQPTWDRACHLQAEMFQAAAAAGGLAMQLLYYRGFREFHQTPWLRDTAQLRRHMSGVRCLGGLTQLERVMRHACAETRRKRIHALVFVGDCVEEPADPLCHKAGELGMLGTPMFVFQEGTDPGARRVFAQMARLSGGAYLPLDTRSASELRELLLAVAVFAAGGAGALAEHAQLRGGAPGRLLTQLRGGS